MAAAAATAATTASAWLSGDSLVAHKRNSNAGGRAAVRRGPLRVSAAVAPDYSSSATAIAAAASSSSSAAAAEPLLVRAARGERVERPPVWMMRQAGRYMKVYQELCEKYPTFRERSETVDLSVEISLQPWRAFKPDGVILFSDILTPLTGMNIPFDILKGSGPVIHQPVRTREDVDRVRTLDPEADLAYVGETLRALRAEVGNDSAVLGFVGAPWTLASYIVEGASSKDYLTIKRLAYENPHVLHALLDKLAESVEIYIRYQADNGAQAVQIFDSWGSFLPPADWDNFSLPYITRIVNNVKATHPHLPLILYASGSGGLMERMGGTGVDVVSIDWSVDMADARKRVGQAAVQGNLDPAVLFASQDIITAKVKEVIDKAGPSGHIMNLGHGVHPRTPEANVAHFFDTVKSMTY
eukprot:jgi/Chlat1/6985/Chrsp56S06682